MFNKPFNIKQRKEHKIQHNNIPAISAIQLIQILLQFLLLNNSLFPIYSRVPNWLLYRLRRSIGICISLIND
jgi:hypothetical protein